MREHLGDVVNTNDADTLTHNTPGALLQNDFHTLIELTNDDNDDDEVGAKLESISMSLKQKQQKQHKHFRHLCVDDDDNYDDDNDDDDNNNDDSSDMDDVMANHSSNNFIRTNLNDYNKSISSTPFASVTDSALSLRSILESKSRITQLLHSLTQIMTTAAKPNTDTLDEDGRNDTFSDTQLLTDRINACQIYLSICLLCPDSWSTGWIDVVSMRYVETIMRKWSSFCCQLKLMLSEDNDNADHNDSDDDSDNTYDGGKSRLKRTRLNTDQRQKQHTNREIRTGHKSRRSTNDSSSRNNIKKKSLYHKAIRNGIELSKTMGHILLQPEKTNFWSWNIEARDAFFDGIILGLSTCSALCVNNYLTFNNHDDDHTMAGSNLETFCIDAVRGVSHALKFSLLSSVESFIEKDNGDDITGDDVFHSPRHCAYGSTTTIYDATERSRTTAVTILRNIHPLLTYQMELPNGVKGKQAAFEKCQMVICEMIGSLSSKLKVSSYKSVTISIPHTAIDGSGAIERKLDSNKNRNMMSTPLMGRQKEQRPSPSITPKSTNKRKVVQNKDGLKLAIPPSLKKSVTPKRLSHRKSHRIQSSQSTTRSKATTNEIPAKTILDIFLALMQRLAIGRNMERVEVRTRISSLLKCALEKMDVTYKVSFVSFVIRLCGSKISSHRIFGVELLSTFLVMDWIWNDEHCHFG